MSERCDSVLGAIGHTPLVRLRKFSSRDGPALYAKLEAANPSGSAKDRAALVMIEAAERQYALKRGSRIIVSTSGNMGVAMAMICAHKDYRLYCLVDPKISRANERSLRIYGASVIKVWNRDHTGGYHGSRLDKVAEVRRRYPDAIYIDQYDSESNIYAHYSTTAPEIDAAMNGQVDGVVIAAGTGGTSMGIARYFKEHRPGTKIVLVDEHGSVALPNHQGCALRYLNGMGTVVPPANYNPPTFADFVDRVEYVRAGQAISAAVELARSEGVLAGGTGGAVAYVMKYIMPQFFGPDSTLVGVLADHGSRYMDDQFDSEWLKSNGISVPDLDFDEEDLDP